MSPQKIIIGLFIALVALLSFGATASAQVEIANTSVETTSSLTEAEQINALLEQIQALLLIVEALQAQLAAANANGGVISTEFTNNLSIGSKGFEVKALQEMLNTDKRTQVASSGDGSLGRETDYYGSLTANAVSKFQELYRSEILTPNDLLRGNGFFGPSTRKKMNALIKARMASTIAQTPSNDQNQTQNQTQNQNSQTSSGNIQPLSQNSSQNLENSLNSGSNALSDISVLGAGYEVYDGFSVGKASSYVGAPGETITIAGTNLTNGTKIHFVDNVVTGTANAEGTSLSFKVPNIKKGPYFLTFTSASGEKAIRVMDFTITVQNAAAPEIFTITPSLGKSGTLVTIYGKNFTLKDNQVEFGQNIITGVSSTDGKSIIINVDPGLEISPGGEWPVFVYLANANGRAEKPGVFIIKN